MTYTEGWPKEMSLNYRGKQRTSSAEDEMSYHQVVLHSDAERMRKALVEIADASHKHGDCCRMEDIAREALQ